MKRYDFVLFLRNIKRYKSTFLINIVGLSIGLAASLLIYLWVFDEISMDKFHENDSHLYQVMRKTANRPEIIDIDENNSDLLAPALIEGMPEVQYAVAVNTSCSGTLSANDKNIKASGMLAGKDFFNIFSYPLIRGQKDQALTGTNNIVISDELASKFFGQMEVAIDKTIEFDFDQDSYDGPYTISGIFKKSGYRSSEQFDFLLTNDLFLAKRNPDYVNWGSNSVNVYLTLKKGTDLNHFKDKVKGYVREKFQVEGEPDGVDWVGQLFLRPYSDKYLYNRYENGVQSGGRIDYVRLFSVIALFVLIIACINFMNLSTAQASRKLKQIGVKKAMGSSRRKLIFQFFGESLLMVFLSLLFGIILVLLFLPQFNEITGKQLVIELDKNLILAGLGLILFTGLMAGSYPAVYLSGLNTIRALKGKLNGSGGEFWARKGLVVFQFTISIILISAVLVVSKQMQYVHSKNLGYKKDNIITFDREGKLNKSLEAFLSEAGSTVGVTGATSINTFRGSVVENNHSTGSYFVKGQPSNKSNPILSNAEVGYDFVKTLGIEMKEGRSFSRTFANESSKIILNQKATEVLEINDPLGKVINWKGEDKEVVGVVKNFHFQSLFEEIKPLALLHDPSQTTTVVIKLQPGNTRETISRLEELYLKYNPGIPFDFKFLDEEYQLLYNSEQRVASLSKYFAGLAILISCLGLFALAAFTSERRRKEIGIRKVLGQSAIQVTVMLSSEFAKLILVSILIALPVAYGMTSAWLSGFAYRVPLQFWYFMAAGLLVILVAMFTVSSQAIRAANQDPIVALKEE